MSTERMTTASKLMHSKWMLPGFSVLIGLIYLGAEIVGGKARDGVAMLAVMVVFALAVLLAGRSETVRGLLETAATSASRCWTCAPRRTRV